VNRSAKPRPSSLREGGKISYRSIVSQPSAVEMDRVNAASSTLCMIVSQASLLAKAMSASNDASFFAETVE
jgi:hypothetical protein